ncbi:MAG: hypothetical protein FWH18_00945 [Marinilabiliaceae bacterium]|nr:hypothetical protein [Marinilabiliaceae bacterium]
MKIVTITLFTAMTLFSCSGQTKQSNNMKNDKSLNLVEYPVSVGLGMFEVSFNLPVPLYRTENDTTPFDTLIFRQDKNGVLHYETKYLKSFKPYKISGGDSHEAAIAHINMGLVGFPPELAFRVIEANESYYRVVIDEESFETVVIRKAPDYVELPQCSSLFGVDMPKDRVYKGYYAFETWEHLLKRAEFVDFYGVKYVVYDAPDGNKIFENTNLKFLPYNVTEVRGDWVKVKKGFGREFNFEGIENAEGWVKWKNDTKILIGITEYTVE